MLLSLFLDLALKMLLIHLTVSHLLSYPISQVLSKCVLYRLFHLVTKPRANSSLNLELLVLYLLTILLIIVLVIKGLIWSSNP